MTIATSAKHPKSSLEVDEANQAVSNYFRSQFQTKIIEGAAAATNLGAVFFCNGDLSSAIEFFREALLDVKLAFAQDESSIDTDSLKRAAHRVAQANTGGSSSISSPFDCPSKSLLETLEEDFFHDDVFLHPLTIQAPTIDQYGVIRYFSSDSDIDSSIFSAIIIYNIAISTHEMTRLSHPGQRQSALRQRTNALYDMCHQLLTNALEQIDLVAEASSASLAVKDIGRAMIDLINMATVNNQAQLFVNTVDHQLTFLHVDHLVDLASAAMEQNYNDERLNAAVHSSASFFLMNATQPKLFRNGAAPAA